MTRRYTNAEIDAILSRAEEIAGQVGRLQERIRQLESANRRLRRLNQMRRPARLIHKAHEAAVKLAAVGLMGYPLTRENALEIGRIGERSFFYGRAMLELAEVVADGLLLISDPVEVDNSLVYQALLSSRGPWARFPARRVFERGQPSRRLVRG